MEGSQTLVVRVSAEVLQAVRQHARSNMDAEVCGVLLGAFEGGITTVTARIPGEGAAQGGAHVTFTQATWEHIYKIKDQQFPMERIVGWYHSHPGFGVFLSEYDLFIHKNFFSNPGQVAWVYDPHSDEEGCFIWVNDKIDRVATLLVLDGRGGGEGGSDQRVRDREVETLPVPSGSRITVVVTQWARKLPRVVPILAAVMTVFLLGLGVGYFLQERTHRGCGASRHGSPVATRGDGAKTEEGGKRNVTGSTVVPTNGVSQSRDTPAGGPKKSHRSIRADGAGGKR